MKLIGNRILAEVIPAEEKTESGIIIPEKINLKKNRAEIVLVGPEVKHYKVGQIIIYNPQNAIFDVVRGTDCVFLKENADIIGLIEKD